LSFADSRWALQDSVRVEPFDGREVLAITNGFAFRRDVSLRDGTIDVDVMTTRRRSFVYVLFRIQSEGNQEEFYLRPHKSGLPDAIQYAPVYQGQSAWQLYHGANGTAAPEIEPGVWNHLRIVLQGRQAAVFFGDTTKPVLHIRRLGQEPIAGSVAMRGFLPPGTSGSGPIVRFSNLKVRPDYVPYTFPATAVEAAVPGMVRAWNVSAAFVAPDSALLTAPPAATAAPMKRVEALANGLVELHRLIPLPRGVRNAGTVARLVIDADAAGLYRMNLGFSDRVTVSLNGAPIFHRDDSYSYENRRDGLISLEQAVVYLPLRAGRNELSLIVTDRFGGWGLVGQFASMQGLRIIEPSQ